MAVAETGMLAPEELSGTDRQILDELHEGARTKGYLVDATGKHRNTIRQRLEVLTAGDVVECIHDGTRLYRLADDPRRPDVDHDAVRAKLEAGARERWGDEWTVETQHFADGTEQSYAYHQRGHADEGIVERERLFPGADGELYHDHIVIDTESVVEVIERDEQFEG